MILAVLDSNVCAVINERTTCTPAIYEHSAPIYASDYTFEGLSGFIQCSCSLPWVHRLTRAG